MKFTQIFYGDYNKNVNQIMVIEKEALLLAKSKLDYEQKVNKLYELEKQLNSKLNGIFDNNKNIIFFLVFMLSLIILLTIFYNVIFNQKISLIGIIISGIFFIIYFYTAKLINPIFFIILEIYRKKKVIQRLKEKLFEVSTYNDLIEIKQEQNLK